MGLTYKEDKHLEFLKDQENDSLDVLVQLLIYDKDSEKRYTQELSGSDKYIKYQPNHQKYWELIIAELKKYGGNSIINLFRSHGVPYEEILKDVCEKMEVEFSIDSKVVDNEKLLLLKVMEKTIEEMSNKEREKFLRDLNIKSTDFSKHAIMIAIQSAIRGNGFITYQLAVIIANSIAGQLVGHGLRFAANAGLVRALSTFAGPVGWLITGIWTAVDLSGPAYRVTIPATIYIAALRQAELNKEYFEIRCPHCNTLITNREIEVCENCGGEYL